MRHMAWQGSYNQADVIRMQKEMKQGTKLETQKDKKLTREDMFLIKMSTAKQTL